MEQVDVGPKRLFRWYWTTNDLGTSESRSRMHWRHVVKYDNRRGERRHERETEDTVVKDEPEKVGDREGNTTGKEEGFGDI